MRDKMTKNDDRLWSTIELLVNRVTELESNIEKNKRDILHIKDQYENNKLYRLLERINRQHLWVALALIAIISALIVCLTIK